MVGTVAPLAIELPVPEALQRLVSERTAQLTEANARLQAEIDERRRTQRALRTLGECNEAMVRATEEAPLLDAVCRTLVEVGGYRMSWVGLAEHDEARTIRPVAKSGVEAGYLERAAIVWADVPRGRGPCGTAVRTGKPQLVRDVTAAPEFGAWRDDALARGYASVATFPLEGDDGVLGVLTIYAAEPDAFDGDELRLLGDLAKDVAFGVTALRNRAERARMTAQLIQADRMVAIGALAAGVAHEINNPLAAVLAGLEFLAREVPGRLGDPLDAGELHDVLGEMRQGVDRIRQAVRDLRSLSREDTGALRPTSLPDVLDASLRTAAGAFGGRARLVKSYGAAPRVAANPARLGQVFTSLLVNAAEAIAEGAPERNEVRVSTTTDGSGRAVVEIRDTGCGIAAEHLGRVFDPFFTTKAVGSGTGLGLAIARRVVSSLRGDISFETEVGKGTTFRISLPAATPPEPAPPSP